jgi:hypothetical protein
MRSRLTALASVVIVALAFGSSTAAAQATSTICKDGTRSAVSGRGACGGHGVDAKATDAARKAATTAKKAEKSETKAEKKAEKKAENAEKKVAMVKCKDGATSKGGRGACSGHGGIAK